MLIESFWHSSGSVFDKTEYFNPFIPECLKWTLPSLNLDTFIVANRGFTHKSVAEWQIV